MTRVAIEPRRVAAAAAQFGRRDPDGGRRGRQYRGADRAGGRGAARRHDGGLGATLSREHESLVLAAPLRDAANRLVAE